MKIQTVLFILLCKSLAFSQCPCQEISQDSAMARYDNIVLVKVISKSISNYRQKGDYCAKGFINTFKVLTKIKGKYNQGDTLTSLTGNGINDNGYIFEVGEDYILFPEDYIDHCSPTFKCDDGRCQKFIYYYWQKYHYSSTRPPPPPPPSPSTFRSTLWKYESRPSFYFTGLRADITNSNKEELLSNLKNIIQEEGITPHKCFINISLNSQNQIISGKIIPPDHKGTIELSNAMKTFIETNINFITNGETCLIDNSRWFYRFE